MIETRRMTVQVGTFLLHDVSVSIARGTYCVLMGKTGSGKTTLLEAVCGLKRIVSGQVVLDGRDVTNLKPAERGIGFVPQDGALFPTMTVRRHLEFAVDIRNWPRRQIAQRVDQLATTLGLEHLLGRKPHELSGGERQRVALGRALSFRPAILCLDEPLSALDDDTRGEMINLLKRVQQETDVTALHVTHNRGEADQLADLGLHIADGVVRKFNPNGAASDQVAGPKRSMLR